MNDILDRRDFLKSVGLGVALSLQKHSPVFGQSWLGVLKGRPGRRSFLYEYFQEADRKYKRPTILAVRTKRWKYVTYPLDDSLTSELYDMHNDPEELNNLVEESEYVNIIREMKKELEQLTREAGFRFPEQK